MTDCYGKGVREQVECGHVNEVSSFHSLLTCTKARQLCVGCYRPWTKMHKKN